eukprot:TRINITY_DN22360_c0_g1_i1.p1 TRINITY_DN22360_c0_g1~~TRINITY_DN22360_c0_g1_i1.p1  ORF type:complete len:269 (+),score=22.27 TRINITY_DN22360_c0_g1_i1:49-855(+)
MATRGLTVADLVAQTKLSIWPKEESAQLGRETSCAICQQAFEPSEILRTVTAQDSPCLHTFHACCLEQWLVRRTTCPSCRAPLFREEEDSEMEETDDEDMPVEDDTDDAMPEPSLSDGSDAQSLPDGDEPHQTEDIQASAGQSLLERLLARRSVTATQWQCTGPAAGLHQPDGTVDVNAPAADAPVECRPLRIFVRYGGRIRELAMNTQDTVTKLCTKIRQEFGLTSASPLPVRSTEVVRYKSQICRYHECSLAFYNIQDESTLDYSP